MLRGVSRGGLGQANGGVLVMLVHAERRDSWTVIEHFPESAVLRRMSFCPPPSPSC